jgi:hypothetical protein
VFPSALLFAKLNMPDKSVVPPEYVLTPPSVSVPVSLFTVNPPFPETTPEYV